MKKYSFPPNVRPASCLAIVAASVLVLFLMLSFVGAEDWPKWRGPRSDGTWQAPALPEKWPATGVKTVWRQPIGGGYAGIAVANGRVFTLDREKLQVPKGGDAKQAGEVDGYERVLCYDAESGRPLWSHKYPTQYGDMGGYSNGPRAMPTVHDGRVYTLGAVGHVYCLDAATGKVIWAKDMVREQKARVPTWGFAASPVIDGDHVIVHTGADRDGCLVAFHRVSGKEVWRSLPDPAGYCTPIVIQTQGGRQLVVWTPENIHGLEPSTGKCLWSVPYRVTYGVSIATPIFREDVIFVTGYWEGSKAVQLGPGAKDARLLWQETQRLCGLMAQPLYKGGYAYVLDKHAGLVCVEFKSGKRLWSDHRLTPRGTNPHSSIVWLDESDRVLILNAVGELILARLDPTGYHEQSRTQAIKGKVWSHPAYADRYLYVRSDGAEHALTEGPFELVCLALVDSPLKKGN